MNVSTDLYGRQAKLIIRIILLVDGYIGIGSNLGQPDFEVRRAISYLPTQGIRIIHCSSLYQTEPLDTTENDWFINAVALVTFNGKPRDLLHMCLEMETSRGRKRKFNNAPRALDLDILLLGDLVQSDKDLTIPHPRMHERRFVLEPMVQIAPNVTHPVLGETMQILLERCLDNSEVAKLQQDILVL